MFSRRSHLNASALPTSAIARATAAARASGRQLFDLTESNPTRAGIPYDAAAILRSLASPSSLAYEPEPFGLRHAREAVAGHLAEQGLRVDASRVVLTASTSEAYAFAFKLLCDPGDAVLVPRPSYPLFEHLASLEAVTTRAYRLGYAGGWHVDGSSVRSAAAAAGGRARAVFCVSPNNPTGSFLKSDEAEAFGSLGLPVVSDEVFAPYALRDDPARLPSVLAASDVAPLVISLGGLSKSAGLPQMKLAWMALAGEARRVEQALERLEIIADAFLSVGTPVQHALPALLEVTRRTQGAIRDRVAANARWLAAACRGSPATLLDVEGGWYAVLRVPATVSEEAWVLAALDDGVIVHPGHFFDFESEAHLVLSLLAPEDAWREGCARLLDRVMRDA